MIEVPSSQETDALADWAEASCLFGKRMSVSENEIENALDDAGVLDPDEAVSNIWLEIDRRHMEADKFHPVKSLTGRLERIQQWNKNPAYAFQLLLAYQSHCQATRRTRTGWSATAKLFERLSTLALKQYLGGKAINIGAPREGEVPAGFGDCLNYLCSALNEEKGHKRLYKSQTKDDGVDVIAWLPFGDARPGQVIILVQCATGGNWKSKTSEIKLELWREHISWVTQPLKAFAFPFVCNDTTQWTRLSKEAGGLLLDRLRITSMFVAGDDSFKTVQRELRQWCSGQLPSLPLLK